MIRSRLFLYLLLFGGLVFSLQPAHAQRDRYNNRYAGPQDNGLSDDDALAREKGKSPALLFKPKMSTPAAQMKYANGLLEQGEAKAARNAYDDLVHEWHESEQAAGAQFQLAALLQDARKYSDAFDEYEYLVKNFGGGYSFAKVIDQMFRMGNHLMTTKEKKTFGGGGPAQAVKIFGSIVRNAPQSERAAESQYYIGLIHEQDKRYVDAIDAYRAVQERYRKSSFAVDAMFRESCCRYEIATRSTRDEEAIREGLSVLTLFNRRYPEHSGRTEAETKAAELKTLMVDIYYSRAHFYDKKARRPKAALIAYQDLVKAFPFSGKAAEVNRRIEELKEQLGEQN